MVHLAAAVKEVVKIPVMSVGNLGWPDLAEKVLEEGKADFIVMGRALLADPDLPNKLKEGRPEDIRPCIGDNEGCNERIITFKYISCSVNPQTGNEKALAVTPAEKQKSVLVVGGGPGGMEAAIISAQRGHQVALWEKSSKLGGSLIPGTVPDFKQDYRDYLKYLYTQLEKLGVKVELNKEATPQLVLNMKPDVVFLAIGAVSFIPNIPGAKNKNVITAIDLLLTKKETGNSVAVIGGGLVGCETALYLAQKGKVVTIIEMLDDVIPDVHMVNRIYLLELLAKHKVNILTKVRAQEITDSGATVIDKDDNRKTIKADTIVLAMGMIPRNGLLPALEDKIPEVYSIGDCVKARKVKDAVWEAFRIARRI
jgi:NADPH-dependent 2,4-dienoyl-CoA reductase/sulfur reductase-like enzyme